MAEEKNSLLRQPVNLSLVGTLMSRQSDVTVSIAIEWNLEFEGKTDACCSDSCPFVTCPFSWESSVSGITFCPRNSCMKFNWFLFVRHEKKMFYLFFPILLIDYCRRALNSPPLAPCSRSYPSLSKDCQERVYFTLIQRSTGQWFLSIDRFRGKISWWEDCSLTWARFGW